MGRSRRERKERAAVERAAIREAAKPWSVNLPKNRPCALLVLDETGHLWVTAGTFEGNTGNAVYIKPHMHSVAGPTAIHQVVDSLLVKDAENRLGGSFDPEIKT
jgi:hypothetical protein